MRRRFRPLTYGNLFLVYRRVNRIDIIKRLPGLQTGVILLGGLKNGLGAKTKMLVDHDTAAESHEETAEGGHSRQALPVEQARPVF